MSKTTKKIQYESYKFLMEEERKDAKVVMQDKSGTTLFLFEKDFTFIGWLKLWFKRTKYWGK